MQSTVRESCQALQQIPWHATAEPSPIKMLLRAQKQCLLPYCHEQTGHTQRLLERQHG